MAITMCPCEGSSQLSAHGYDPAEQKLRIQFKTGTTYEYDGVPPEVYDSLTKAKSMGRWFAENIKAKPYYYRKLDADKK